MLVGTYLYLHAVGAGNPVAVPAWHGRGLNEVPITAIRGICSCWEARYGGFWKNIISVRQHRDLPLGMSDMFFQHLNTRRYSPVTAGTMSVDCFFGEEGYGRISDGTRVLELAADIREAALGHGARLQQPAMRNLLVSHGGEGRRYAGRRWVATGGAARSGGKGREDLLPPEKSGTGGFRQNIPVPTIF
jgi:hypothetical protein